MDIVIGIVVGAFIALVLGSRKKRRSKQSKDTIAEHDQDKIRQADEELITVVLPTIDSDK